jgi:hypothetical protein
MPWPSCLEINETLLTVKKGKTNFIEVQANNPTNHDIVIKRRTVSGRLQLVRSVTAIPLKLREETIENGSQVDQTCKVSECSVAFTDEIQSVVGTPDHIKNIDLKGLTPEQRSGCYLRMLAQEADAFSILRLGFPEKLHHDQGGEFENHLFKQLEKLVVLDIQGLPRIIRKAMAKWNASIVPSLPCCEPYRKRKNHNGKTTSRKWYTPIIARVTSQQDSRHFISYLADTLVYLLI